MEFCSPGLPHWHPERQTGHFHTMYRLHCRGLHPSLHLNFPCPCVLMAGERVQAPNVLFRQRESKPAELD